MSAEISEATRLLGFNEADIAVSDARRLVHFAEGLCARSAKVAEAAGRERRVMSGAARRLVEASAALLEDARKLRDAAEAELRYAENVREQSRAKREEQP